MTDVTIHLAHRKSLLIVQLVVMRVGWLPYTAGYIGSLVTFNLSLQVRKLIIS